MRNEQLEFKSAELNTSGNLPKLSKALKLAKQFVFDEIGLTKKVEQKLELELLSHEIDQLVVRVKMLTDLQSVNDSDT